MSTKPKRQYWVDAPFNKLRSLLLEEGLLASDIEGIRDAMRAANSNWDYTAEHIKKGIAKLREHGELHVLANKPPEPTMDLEQPIHTPAHVVPRPQVMAQARKGFYAEALRSRQPTGDLEANLANVPPTSNPAQRTSAPSSQPSTPSVSPPPAKRRVHPIPLADDTEEDLLLNFTSPSSTTLNSFSSLAATPSHATRHRPIYDDDENEEMMWAMRESQQDSYRFPTPAARAPPLNSLDLRNLSSPTGVFRDITYYVCNRPGGTEKRTGVVYLAIFCAPRDTVRFNVSQSTLTISKTTSAIRFDSIGEHERSTIAQIMAQNLETHPPDSDTSRVTIQLPAKVHPAIEPLRNEQTGMDAKTIMVCVRLAGEIRTPWTAATDDEASAYIF